MAVTACSSQPTPEPTPEPTTFPVASPEDAAALAADYLEAWAAGDYAAMYATLDPAQREQYPIERFTELHAAFAEMAARGRALGHDRRTAYRRASPGAATRGLSGANTDTGAVGRSVRGRIVIG